ncbi:histone-binding protein N1/N2 [Leguminivora glycinivorella]|uniref:histone-binding protein N1/N2 n=1 Tax=Leguminivora glycinivorella TaxID=1035111 RepID=UPI0020106BC5|nr:histone-binding protein N1/N2 [Leguminivora glycinivorella]XP_047994904.1 histone-binding protein N1/N2 [Leguminivora glycinivorella]
MTEVEVTQTPSELLASGRRNLAVRDYNAATEALAKACELLAKEHGDTADQCAEAYLWYGKALLGLSREESGVLGDGMPGTGNADGEEEDDNEEQEENGENGEEENGEAEAEPVKAEADDGVKKSEAESTTKDEPASSSTADDQPGPSNGEAADESMADLENEDDVDNLQLAWEMLDLARSILRRRVEGGGDAARAQLADVHLALGEVALESETYDKAVIDMQSCLEIQKELYSSDDRRIAETHYQIGLANSLASNFEDAITHFKNAANILETRIKTLENPAAVKDDATVKKHSTADPLYSIEAEIKELKELLPEIQEKIQDMMDYKTETKKRLAETLFSSNGESSHLNGAGSSSSEAKPKPAASDISHLIKRKRKSSETEEASSAKRANT